MARSYLQVLIEIISSCRSPVKRSHLICDARLGGSVNSNKYVGFLIETGFIEKVDAPRKSSGKLVDEKTPFLFKATEKGLKILELVECSSVNELFEFGKK